MAKRTKKKAKKPTKGASPRKVTPAAQPQRRRTSKHTLSTATEEIDPAQTFPFLSLPLEIQSEIFKWTRNYCKTPKSFLLTSRSIYESLAPVFWQTSTISIKHPIKFANCLKKASPIFRHNIRHIRYVASYLDERFQNLHDRETDAEISTREFPNDDFIPLRTDMRKLLKILPANEGELAQRLDTFSIWVYPSRTFMCTVEKNPSYYPDADAVWKLASDRCNKWFLAFQQKLLYGALQGFEVSKTAFSFNNSLPLSGQIVNRKTVDRLTMEFKRSNHQQGQFTN